jgi:hypothetical protein
MSLSYLKLAVLAAAVIVALHVFEDRDLALTLCFSTLSPSRHGQARAHASVPKQATGEEAEAWSIRMEGYGGLAPLRSSSRTVAGLSSPSTRRHPSRNSGVGPISTVIFHF